ncbi:MAG: hypothetical protein K6G40_05350 [Eubacterium sp.]|nr:hypothetical protein [Eubacterium sp.]
MGKDEEAGVDMQIVLDDVSLALYPTFEDNDEALTNIKEKCSNVLSKLQEDYELDVFSADNWEEYSLVLLEFKGMSI